MKKNRRKIFSILITTALLVAMSATSVFACGQTGRSSGFATCNKVTWGCGGYQRSAVVSTKSCCTKNYCTKSCYPKSCYPKSCYPKSCYPKYCYPKYYCPKWCCPKTGYTAYTVRYVDRATGNDVASPKTVENQRVGDTVREEAVAVDQYELDDASSKELTLQKEDNEIIFYYKTAVANTTYTVRYVDRATGNDIAPSKIVENQNVGDTVREEAIAIDKYELDDASSKELTLQKEDNEIIFYYKTEGANFTVRYVDITSGEYVDIIDPEVGTGNIGSTISRTSKRFDGYIFVGSSTNQSVTLTSNDDENVIIFEYKHME